MKTNRRNFISKMGAGATGLALGTTPASMVLSDQKASKKKEEDGQI